MKPSEQAWRLLKDRQFRYGAGISLPDKTKGVAGTFKREDFVKPGPMPGFVYLRNVGQGNDLMYDQPLASGGDKMVSEAEAENFWPSHISQRTFMAPTMYGLGIDADAAAFRMKNMRYAPPDTDFHEQETVNRFAQFMAPTMAHETMHGLDSDFSQGSFDQVELPAHILEVATREAQKAREGKYRPEAIIPKASQLLADRPESGQPPNPDYEFDLTSEPIVTGEPMDLAWRLLKMPLYHGTTRERAEQIMREGLKPTSHAPQLFEMEPEEIQAAMIEAGRDPADYERLFGGDWNFAYGDQSGREPAISDAALYGGDDPAVIEIDENHPDAPQFMLEPYYPEIEDSDLDFFHDPLSQGFNRLKNQMRSNQIVPPSAMRILQPEEIPEREF